MGGLFSGTLACSLAGEAGVPEIGGVMMVGAGADPVCCADSDSAAFATSGSG